MTNILLRRCTSLGEAVGWAQIGNFIEPKKILVIMVQFEQASSYINRIVQI